MSLKAVAASAILVAVTLAVQGCGGTLPHPHFDADVEGWTQCGRAGGCSYNGRKYNSTQAFEQVFTIHNRSSVDTVEALTDLGAAGGGMYSGKFLSAKQCYGAALALDPKSLKAWMSLAIAGGGLVDGKEHDIKACWEQVLSVDPTHSQGWAKLAELGGGKVDGKEVSAVECGQKSVEMDVDNPIVWFNFADKFKEGTINGKHYTEVDLFTQASNLDPQMETKALYRLEVLGGCQGDETGHCSVRRRPISRLWALSAPVRVAHEHAPAATVAAALCPATLGLLAMAAALRMRRGAVMEEAEALVSRAELSEA